MTRPLIIALLPLLACSSPRLADAEDARPPFLKGRPGFSGEAAVAMALQSQGHAITPDEVFELAGLDPVKGRPCELADLRRALARLGLPPAGSEPSSSVEAAIALVTSELARGVPSILRLKDGAAPPRFALAIGRAGAAFLIHDPGQGPNKILTAGELRGQLLAALPEGAAPLPIPKLALRERPPTRPGHSRAAFAEHVGKLRPRLPEGFTLILEPPFIVLGDEAPAQVERRAIQTVRWFTSRLKTLYFEKDPAAILEVWLFKNRASYLTNTKRLFDDEPDTPYGYYSSAKGALIMNIETGGGTLCHEIVHPFIEANIPNCPSWFNEGLGSLYEQCAERDGQLAGLTNWRLAGLQKAIRADELRALPSLLATSRREFYGAQSGSNYAQARYLLYYLQEKKLLGEFTRRLRAGLAVDPGGLQALKATLGTEDLADFEKTWRRYVLELRFP